MSAVQKAAYLVERSVDAMVERMAECLVELTAVPWDEPLVGN